MFDSIYFNGDEYKEMWLDGALIWSKEVEEDKEVMLVDFTQETFNGFPACMVEYLNKETSGNETHDNSNIKAYVHKPNIGYEIPPHNQAFNYIVTFKLILHFVAPHTGKLEIGFYGQNTNTYNITLRHSTKMGNVTGTTISYYTLREDGDVNKTITGDVESGKQYVIELSISEPTYITSPMDFCDGGLKYIKYVSVK